MVVGIAIFFCLRPIFASTFEPRVTPSLRGFAGTAQVRIRRATQRQGPQLFARGRVTLPETPVSLGDSAAIVTTYSRAGAR